jgi:sec-independent protein translocase protein TatB
MFDFDAGKLIIIGIVALIVIGPKELPRVMRQLGQAAAKLRRMAAEFRGQFMDAMREAELDDVKTDVEKLAESAKIGVGIDPLAQIKAEITNAMEAADKPATLPVDETPALAAPHNPDQSLNSIALPLPELTEQGNESFVAAGVAPVVPEPEGIVAPGTAPPAPGAVDAEMRALADALAAEMREGEPRQAATDRAKTPD